MGMMRAPSDQDYDDEQLLNRESRDAKRPVYCTEPSCNWTVWGDAAKERNPKCSRHHPATTLALPTVKERRAVSTKRMVSVRRKVA